MNIPTTFVKDDNALNGLNNKTIPHNVLIIDITIVVFHKLFPFAFNSNAYCNLVALLITILIPKIAGIILAIACGFFITIIPRITLTIPYTMSSSAFCSLFVFF